MGFLLFAAGFVILYVLIDAIVLSGKAIKGLIALITAIFEGIFRSSIEKENMKDNLYLKQEKKKKEIIAKEVQKLKKKKEEEMLLNRDKEFDSEKYKIMANNILGKVNELKFRFPYADDNLYDEFIQSGGDLFAYEYDQFIQKIKDSHNKNYELEKYKNYNYSYKDVENLVPIDSKYENPIEFNLYKIKADFIIVIKNHDTKKINMYQSRSYVNIMDICTLILNEIIRLGNKKDLINAMNIDLLVNQLNNK